MSGYLQRLLDSALPAAEPAALTPVVKSTSPVFEQNQLLGLSAFQAGEPDAETIAPLSEGLGPQDRSAPATPLPADVRPPPEALRLDLPPVTPAPWPGAEVIPAMAAPVLAPRPTAAGGAAARPQASSVAEVGPEQPGPEILGPNLPRMTVTAPTSERAAGMPERRVTSEPGVVPADTREARPLIAYGASEPDSSDKPGVPTALTGETARALEPMVRALDSARPPAPLEPLEPPPEESPRPSVLEPRARPDFREVEPDADQPELASPQAPRITIGHVTVELVPDPAPVARSSGLPRTAAAASMIGPLGNRRARRRLFALSRL